MKIIWPALGFRCLLLAGTAVAVLPAGAQVALPTPASANASRAMISNVEVTQPDQQTAVRISGTGELHYRTSRLDSPPRLVVDFAETRLNVEKNKVSSQYAPVLDVRLGQPKPGQSRIVIDLAKQSAFSAQSNGSDVTIFFSNAATLVSPAALHPVKTPAQRKLATVKVPNMPLPAWLTETNAGFARPGNQPLAPEPQNPPAADAQAPAVAPAPEKKYTGDPISVNLKDVDLKDFFRLIHEISGLNVVLDPSVRGTVTLVLDEVPWDQGLDIVLRNNSLAKEIDGNVLRIVTQDTLKREADQRRELVKAQTDAVEMVTVTRVLSYAQAPTLVTTLKKFVTQRGDVYADIRSNTLIIRDIPSSIPKIDNLLREIDRKSLQVEIDARVVQTSRSFARELGTQLAYSFNAGNNTFGGLNSLGASPVTRPFIPGVSNSPALISGTAPLPPAGGTTPSPVNVAQPLATNLAATAATSGLTYLFTSKNFALDFLLSAMESRGVGKILSEPKGITQNNDKLTVKQGQQIPIQTNINNTISVQYVDAVLRLDVTPQITAEGTVFLDITVENTQIDKSIEVSGTPGLDTQSTQTKVLVNDGSTVVIGGVVVTNQNTTIAQVPLLGSVPIIGNLFKHTSISVSTQELMFFVTPRILPG